MIDSRPSGLTPLPVATFSLTVRYADPVVVVARGELDALTAPGFGAVIGALVDTGRRAIVIDLAQLEFIGAAGLGAIAAASVRLQANGGTVALRSPTLTAQRILGITGMINLVEIGVPAPRSTSVLDGSGDAAVVATTPLDSTASADTSSAPMTPSSRDVADAALRLVTALAAAMVTGADGVSVTLRRHGKLSTVGASDHTIAEMDRDQYATGEGPCLSATSEGHPILVESSTEETRWPQFMPHAIERGIASILSTPLIVSDLPVGALNIYSRTERAFGARERHVAALFAHQASDVLAVAGMGQSADDVADRLLTALRSREVIAHAEGSIMTTQRISATDASAQLRRSARQQATSVRALAATIMASATRDDQTGEALR